ncbi:MAG: hypothetical protein F6J93_07940 [Oscillatoria sp. SIO1A7]|nr:hypothetical protein [Oscillatoria sp. SIO1A7]
MVLLYRAMREKNGQPKIGRSPRLLGVRLGTDIDVEQIPIHRLDERGFLQEVLVKLINSGNLVDVVIKNNKGMSASLSIEALPIFRKPPEFGGTGRDPLWKIDDSKISGNIEVVRDSPTHVSIRPRQTMLLELYETALTNTQKDWQKVTVTDR